MTVIRLDGVPVNGFASYPEADRCAEIHANGERCTRVHQHGVEEKSYLGLFHITPSDHVWYTDLKEFPLPSPAVPISARQLRDLLAGHQFASRTESQLQSAIEECLKQNGIAYQREFRLTEKDRPDFIVGKVAIEIKIDGSCSEVIRQLYRYAQHPDVEEILLITTCAKHLRIKPATKNVRLNGKEFCTLWIGGVSGL